MMFLQLDSAAYTAELLTTIIICCNLTLKIIIMPKMLYLQEVNLGLPNCYQELNTEEIGTFDSKLSLL